MKFSHVLASLQFAGIVAASPLFIVTGLPYIHNVLEPRKPPAPHTTTDDSFAGLVSSFFGGDPTTTTTDGVLLPPPAIATATSTEEESSAPSAAPSTTEDVSSTSTTDSSTTTEPTTSSTTSSSAPTTTITPPPSTTSVPVASSTATAAPAKSSDDGNGMGTAGIAVLSVFAVIIIAVIIWAIFRYNPRARAWWVARTEKKKDERTWREALDGPSARFSGVGGAAGVSQLRQKALGDEGPGGGDAQSEKAAPQRKSMLQTFFAPTTAKLGNGQEIKRKPVQWGEPSPSSPSTRGSFVSEKISLAQTAAPMGRSTSNKNMPPMPQRMSVAAHPDFGLPPVMPVVNDSGVQRARRGSDGVYRLN